MLEDVKSHNGVELVFREFAARGSHVSDLDGVKRFSGDLRRLGEEFDAGGVTDRANRAQPSHGRPCAATDLENRVHVVRYQGLDLLANVLIIMRNVVG